MESFRDLPTAADYAWAAAQGAQRTAEGEAEAGAKKRLEMDEQVVVLQGQVSFLAGLVQDLINGHGWHSDEDLKMLGKIVERGKE